MPLNIQDISQIDAESYKSELRNYLKKKRGRKLSDFFLYESLHFTPDRVSPDVTGEDLTKLREDLGLDAEFFYRVCGIPGEVLFAWELGSLKPSYGYLLLLDLLGKEPDLKVSVA